MQPAIERVDKNLSGPAALDAAVEANVRWSMQQLFETPEGRARIEKGAFKFVGAVYDRNRGVCGS